MSGQQTSAATLPVSAPSQLPGSSATWKTTTTSLQQEPAEQQPSHLIALPQIQPLNTSNPLPSPAPPPPAPRPILPTSSMASAQICTPCVNCHTANSSLWVKSQEFPGRRVCNACYLYKRKHGTNRDGAVVRRGIKTDGVRVINGTKGYTNRTHFNIKNDIHGQSQTQNNSHRKETTPPSSAGTTTTMGIPGIPPPSSSSSSSTTTTTTSVDLSQIPHCFNCQTTRTSRPWFKSRTHLGSLVCNACWQYEIKHGRPRSKFVVRRGRPISSKKAQGIEYRPIVKREDDNNNNDIKEPTRSSTSPSTSTSNSASVGGSGSGNTSGSGSAAADPVMMHTVFVPSVKNIRLRERKLQRKVKAVIVQLVRKYAGVELHDVVKSSDEMDKFLKNVEIKKL